MSIHDLQEEPESTLGSKPMHEHTQVPRGDMPEFGVSHLRHEEGEETEDGRGDPRARRHGGGRLHAPHPG